MVIGKAPRTSVPDCFLFAQKQPGIILRQFKKRYSLVVTLLAAWILSISNDHEPFFPVHILPFKVKNLFLAEGGCDRKSMMRFIGMNIPGFSSKYLSRVSISSLDGRLSRSEERPMNPKRPKAMRAKRTPSVSTASPCIAAAWVRTVPNRKNQSPR